VARPLVCGIEQPTAGSVSLTSFSLDSPLEVFYGFKSPTGNLACQLFMPGSDFTVACTGVEMEVPYPDSPNLDPALKRGLFLNDIGGGTVYSNQPMALDQFGASENTPVLEYGQYILVNEYPGATPGMTEQPVACFSGTDGITCWNTGTGHGFKLAADQAVAW
jgi:hypothetical protein